MIALINLLTVMKTTQHTSGEAVTVVTNCAETSRPSNGGPIYRFWEKLPGGPAAPH